MDGDRRQLSLFGNDGDDRPEEPAGSRAPTPTARADARGEVVRSASGPARFAAALAFLERHAAAGDLLAVGAGRDSVDDLAHRVAVHRGAVFGLHRFGWDGLISRLAEGPLVAAGLAPASAVGVEAVAARAAFEARDAGVLPRLGAVADHPGFAAALAATLTQLRLAGLEAGSDTVAAMAPEIAELLGRFERRLAEAGTVDRAGLVRLAARGLADDPGFRPLRTSPLVLLDVPLRGPLEQAFAAALVGSRDAVLATVPDGDDEAWRILVECGLAAREVTDPDDADHGLARLRRGLFVAEGLEAREADDRVRFFSAPGEGREALEIAREILVAAGEGTPFDEIAVLVRTPESYNAHLETAFQRAGIPGYFARGARRPDPSGRAFLALLACASENLSARRFAEYLSFGQLPRLAAGAPPEEGGDWWVPPEDDLLGTRAALPAPETPDTSASADEPDRDELPALGGSLRAPWKWEELLVEAAVIGGADRWRRRIAGLERELEARLAQLRGDAPDAPRVAALERELANLRHLATFALPIVDTLAGFPREASWGEWLDGLQRLAPRVLRDPERVLTLLAAMEPMAAIGPVTIDEVRVVLARRVSTIEPAPPARRYGHVFVSTPEQARGRTFRVVFVPGLAERVFPQRPREDPLLLDALRTAISPALETQEDRGHRERLLLRLAVGAASERVLLSYPRVNPTDARPRVPSFYGLEVARATRGEIPDFERLEREAAQEVNARLAWPAPPDPDRAVDPIEHDLAVLDPLLHDVEAHEAEGRARYLLELNENLGRSLRTRWWRWRPGPWRPEDGLVRVTDETRAALEGASPKARTYSVTALERYATCPYKFLLSAIHRLQPREEAVPLERMDPLTRGRMFHEVQAETMRALQSTETLPVTPDNLEQARAVLDATLARVEERYRDDLAPAILRVWRDEVAGMAADLRAWLGHMAAHPGWEPIRFELSFGLPRAPGHDPHSQPDPVTLDGGWRLRGIVDLVERATDGEGLRVTDHKTGLDRTNVGMIVGGGEALQPVLYSLALEAATGETVREARLFFCTARGGFAERVVPLSDFARLYAGQALETIDDSVQHGELPPAPREGACTYCDFRVVCGPWEERRQRHKDRESLEKLRDVRTLP